jgi:hypothetical protein
MSENRTPDVFSFEQEGKTIELVMYAGLLNKVLSTIGGVDNMDELLIKPDIQNEVLRLVLTEYDDDGNEVGKKAKAFKLTTLQQSDLVSWVMGHCADFFVRISDKMTPLKTEMTQKISGLSKVG